MVKRLSARASWQSRLYSHAGAMNPATLRPITSSMTARPPGGGFVAREAEEFALAGGHPLGLEAGEALVTAIVAVRPAVNEHLHSAIRPPPQLAGERRRLRQRRFVPVIR